MADICEAAEHKAQELGRYLTPATRARLSTYDEDTQVAWIANPLMEWILQGYQNKLRSAAGAQQTTTTKNTTTKNTNTSKPSITKVEPKKPEPINDPDDDLDDNIMSIFD